MVVARRWTIQKRLAFFIGKKCALAFSDSHPEAPNVFLWVGEEGKLIQVPTTDGQRFLEIPVQDLEDLAVDLQREVIWVGTRKEVLQYSLQGQRVLSYPLDREDKLDEGQEQECDEDGDDDSSDPVGDDEEDEDCDSEEDHEGKVHLSLDPSDGSLWIGTKEKVIKLSFNGSEIFRMENIGSIRDLSVDLSEGSCWIGLPQQVLKLASDGTILLTVDLESDNRLQALAADPISSSFWAGTKKGLIKIDPEGQEVIRLETHDDIQDLKVDLRNASLWAVSEDEVFKFSPEGTQLFSRAPCGDEERQDEEEDGEEEEGEDAEGSHPP